MRITNIDDAHKFAIVENEIRTHYLQTNYENVEIRIENFERDLFNVFITFNIENFFYVEQFVQKYYAHDNVVCVSFFNAYSIREIAQFDQRVNNYKMRSHNKRNEMK